MNGQRFAEMFQELPLAHRIVAATAGFVLVLSSVLFARWIGEPSYTVLYTNLDDTQLAQVIDALDTDSIDYKLEAGGSRVLVPQSDVYRVRATLASAGIQGAIAPEGYELLDSQGLTVSDFRQKVDYQRALEGELVRTLTAMDHLTYANIHLVIPEEALFTEDEEPVSASVLVDSNRQLTQTEIESITYLVGSAVEGLEPDQVTVAHVSGVVLHAAGEATDSAGLGNRNLRMTRELESALASDVSQLLSSVVGPGRSSVVVRADLNFDEHSTESETYDKESSTPLREQLIDESFTGSGAPPAGTVGVDGAEVAPSTDGDYSYARNEIITEYGIDRLITKTVTVPGSVEHLSVAVILDDGSLTGTAVPPTGDIEALVAAAIGIESERGDTVQVTSIPFPAPENLGEEEPLAESSGSITDLIPQAIGGVVLLVVALGLFLMTRKKEPEASKAQILPADWSPAELPAETKQELAAALGATQVDPVAGLQTDVLELVERQPEEIANLLRAWLADRRTR